MAITRKLTLSLPSSTLPRLDFPDPVGLGERVNDDMDVDHDHGEVVMVMRSHLQAHDCEHGDNGDDDDNDNDGNPRMTSLGQGNSTALLTS